MSNELSDLLRGKRDNIAKLFESVDMVLLDFLIRDDEQCSESRGAGSYLWCC